MLSAAMEYSGTERQTLLLQQQPGLQAVTFPWPALRPWCTSLCWVTADDSSRLFISFGLTVLAPCLEQRHWLAQEQSKSRLETLVRCSVMDKLWFLN